MILLNHLLIHNYKTGSHFLYQQLFIKLSLWSAGLPWWLRGKEPACAGDIKDGV